MNFKNILTHPPSVLHLDLVYMQMDINCQFDLNSCSHGVKVEVRQVDGNNSWLYNENQSL